MSAGCPTEVTIISSTGLYEEGAVLSCNANGYDPSYTWTGAAGVNRDFVMVEDSATYTLPGGQFDLICTATVGELSCCDSAVVTDQAYSKYRKQQKQRHNLVTIFMVMTLSVG